MGKKHISHGNTFISPVTINEIYDNFGYNNKIGYNLETFFILSIFSMLFCFPLFGILLFLFAGSGIGFGDKLFFTLSLSAICAIFAYGIYNNLPYVHKKRYQKCYNLLKNGKMIDGKIEDVSFDSKTVGVSYSFRDMKNNIIYGRYIKKGFTHVNQGDDIKVVYLDEKNHTILLDR